MQMDAIIDVLKSNVKEDYKSWIVDIKRHIVGQDDDTATINFVKRAKERYFYFNSNFIAMFEYENEGYILLPEQYVEPIEDLGLNIETDLAIVYGAGMLAIGNGKLPLRAGVDSLGIIERCLGIEPQDGDDSVVLEFRDIRDVFAPYIVIHIDNSRFELLYEEDLFRLLAYISADCGFPIEDSVNQIIKKIALLKGSRSITPSLVNFYESSLIEYSFLQLYQCVEYLFRLNNSFLISDSYNVDVNAVVDIIQTYELKGSELDNLYRVLKNNASKGSIETFFDLISTSEDENVDKTNVVANYIYKLRCNIAHLRYGQDDSLVGVEWEKCIEALLGIIFSIYNKLDERITSVCLNKNSWKQIII